MSEDEGEKKEKSKPKLNDEKLNQSPIKKLKVEDYNYNSINVKNLNLTEQVPNKIKSRSFMGTKITKDYKEEDEENELNIKYKEYGKKIKAITLDLLLKKITKENFLEENPILIYSFCQQCFCFIDKEILFNKVFECYNYYKNEGVSISQKWELITFLNILVIELYEYYTKVKFDEPIYTILNNIYKTLIMEIYDIINLKDKESEDKKIEEKNEIKEIKEIKEDINININLNNNNNKNLTTRDRYITYHAKNKNEIKNGKEMNNSNQLVSSVNLTRKGVNLQRSKIIREDKTKYGYNIISLNNTNNNNKNLFINLKKEKPIKLGNKSQKEENNQFKLIKNINNTINNKITLEEEIVTELMNIKMLFSFEEPKKRDIDSAKNKIYFYKLIKKLIPELICKPIKEPEHPKGRHVIIKSVTVGNLNKKNKLKLHNNEGYFNVLDWDKSEIGEKLISLSKNLINKVHRREIYKAIFLKKKKNETSPNVMENIDKFNRLTFFIIQDILSYDFAKDRAKIIEKWIKIADYCKDRKDYNDCVAINSALNNYIITGLKKTLNEIGKDKKELLKTISKFCRYQGNYKTLREDMAKLDYNDFYIPYLGMILKDLAFYEENSKYLINDILINFEKLEKVQLAVSSFFNFKNTKDKINLIIPEELNFFDKLEELKESDLEKLANDLEPEFKLYNTKKREKRLTNIDKMYFLDTNVKRPNMIDNKKIIKK